MSDAFHLIPLRQDEWRFALARIGQRIYVFRVAIFGAASAPLVWGRFAAFLGRTTAAVTLPHAARVQIYLDDPIISLAGSPAAIRLELATALAWLSALGVPLAWAKAEGGNTLQWIDKGAEVLRELQS